MNAPILWAFVALAIGIALGDAAAIDAAWWGLAAAAALVALLLALARHRGVVIAALAALAAVGGYSAASETVPQAIDATCSEAAPAWRARVDGPVSRVPDPERGGVSQQVDLEVEALRCLGTWLPRHGKVRATLGAGPDVARGDEIEVRASIRPLTVPRNPTDPDPRILGERFDRSGYARVRSPHVIRRRGTGGFTALERLRNGAAARLEAALPQSTAALAKALGLGDQAAIDPDQREAWARAGTAHLLSVSGLHVAIIAVFVFAIMRFLLGLAPGAAERFSVRQVAAGLTLPAVLLFTVWVGSPACAVRSAIMAGVYFLGLALGRPSAAKNGLGLAGFAILVLDPTSLYDPGFIMSMGAVAALLFAPSLKPATDLKGKLWRLVAGSVVTSLAATVAIAPVTVWYFGQASLIAPISNLVAVPLGSIISTPLAILFQALGPLSHHLQALLGWGLDLSLRILDALAHLLSRIPGAAVYLPRPTVFEIVVYYGLLATSVLAYAHRRFVMVPVSMALLMAGSVGWRVVERFGRDTLTVTLPYVGQAESTLLELPGGETVLVDAAGVENALAGDPGRQVLGPLLRRKGIRSIDLAILTHPHPDHLRGFGYLAPRFPIRELWWTGLGEELPETKALLEAVSAAGGTVRLSGTLPPVVTIHGVTFEVLHPRPGDAGEGLSYFPELSANDNSIVVRVGYRGRSLLLIGDIERATEGMLAPRLAPTEILKIGHHGSKTSSTSEFLAAVRPRLGLIACGEDNRFKFPSPEVLGRLAKVGAAVVRTDQDGMITLTTSGSGWQVSTYRGRTLKLP